MALIQRGHVPLHTRAVTLKIQKLPAGPAESVVDRERSDRSVVVEVRKVEDDSLMPLA